MATLAEVPYQGFANEQVMSYVKEGHKMERPDGCPDVLYEMMSQCWENRPHDRPTFLKLCQKLHTNASEQFAVSAFYHSADGLEAVANEEMTMQLRREAEEAAALDPQTPLTGGIGNGGGSNGENGHLTSSGDSTAAAVTILSGNNR